jgi:hypothetical protein
MVSLNNFSMSWAARATRLPNGQPWAFPEDFDRIESVSPALAGQHGLFPAWLASQISRTVQELPPRLGWSARKELEDLTRRWEEQKFSDFGTDAGTNDWAQNFARRLGQVADNQRKFRNLDFFTGLSIETVDRALLLRASAKMAVAFSGERDEDAARERCARLGIEVDRIGSGRLLPRLRDQAWWKRTLRQNLRQRRENAARQLDARAMRWCSADGMDEREEHDRVAEEWASRNVIEGDDGTCFPCPSPAETARKQYAELMARVNGIKRLSGSDDACLLTLTCPSSFHPTTTQNGRKMRNPSWDGSTPKDAHEWMTTRWKRLRAALKRRRIGQHFVLAVQPHQDGTPHFHIVFFSDIEEHNRIEALARRYFDGGGEHQVDFQKLESAEHGARYAIRAVQYIARATDGKEEDRKEATATKQWSSTWSARRFSASCSAVTAWRLSRRKDVLRESNPLRQAAQAGNYAAFITEWVAGEGKLLKTPILNRFDEPTTKVAGLTCACGGGTKKITWKIKKRTVTLNHQGREAPEINRNPKTSIPDDWGAGTAPPTLH